MTEPQITLISAIASGVGAVAAAGATVALVFLTARYVRLTNRLVEETRAARAPGVVVDIEFDETIARLVVSNRGTSAAHNVRIKVSERNVVWSQRAQDAKLADLSPIKNGVSFLPPGRTMRYYLFAMDVQETLRGNASAIVEFVVSYDDDDGQPFHREFTLDFGAFGDMMVEGRYHQPHHVVADAIRRAAEHLKPRSPFAGPRTRPCPVCFEKIRAEARKCPHCLEAVEPLPQEKPAEPTP